MVTWGRSHTGGDSARVVDLLRNVQQIHATHTAFAAILNDRSVATWGDQDMGGDHTAVMDELRNVQQIHATACAFAATLANGSIVTWALGTDQPTDENKEPLLETHVCWILLTETVH